MPVAAPAGFVLGAVRPDDAVAAFQQRRLLRPSFRWQDVWQAEHARAFAVAGVARLDVLGAIREEVAAAVAEGTSLADFSKRLKAQLVARGWWGNIEITDPATGEVRNTKFNDARLKLIFDVNMRQSTAAGRWARGMRGRMPFIVYRTMGDERVRASHRPWDYLVLPRDHPFWDTHIPPNGWGCRCSFYFTDQAGVDALIAAGKKVRTEPPDTQWVEFLNKVTGQTERVPRGIDPGFAYNPGKVHVAQGVKRLERALAQVGPTRPKGNDALLLTRAVIARGRSERAFADFLKNPPNLSVGLPVAAVPGLAGEPAVASVQGAALVAQAGQAEFPRMLPTLVSQWALGQAIVDRGQRLDLDGSHTLWWWLRGDGANQRVLVFELQRSQLVWWVQALATLTRDEALRAYPSLNKVL